MRGLFAAVLIGCAATCWAQAPAVTPPPPTPIVPAAPTPQPATKIVLLPTFFHPRPEKRIARIKARAARLKALADKLQ